MATLCLHYEGTFCDTGFTTRFHLKRFYYGNMFGCRRFQQLSCNKITLTVLYNTVYRCFNNLLQLYIYHLHWQGRTTMLCTSLSIYTPWRQIKKIAETCKSVFCFQCLQLVGYKLVLCLSTARKTHKFLYFTYTFVSTSDMVYFTWLHVVTLTCHHQTITVCRLEKFNM